MTASELDLAAVKARIAVKARSEAALVHVRAGIAFGGGHPVFRAAVEAVTRSAADVPTLLDRLEQAEREVERLRGDDDAAARFLVAEGWADDDGVSGPALVASSLGHAIDGIAWHLLDQTMGTADRSPSADDLNAARAIARRMLDVRSTKDPS